MNDCSQFGRLQGTLLCSLLILLFQNTLTAEDEPRPDNSSRRTESTDIRLEFPGVQTDRPDPRRLLRKLIDFHPIDRSDGRQTESQNWNPGPNSAQRELRVAESAPLPAKSAYAAPIFDEQPFGETSSNTTPTTGYESRVIPQLSIPVDMNSADAVEVDHNLPGTELDSIQFAETADESEMYVVDSAEYGYLHSESPVGTGVNSAEAPAAAEYKYSVLERETSPIASPADVVSEPISADTSTPTEMETDNQRNGVPSRLLLKKKQSASSSGQLSAEAGSRGRNHVQESEPAADDRNAAASSQVFQPTNQPATVFPFREQRGSTSSSLDSGRGTVIQAAPTTGVDMNFSDQPDDGGQGWNAPPNPSTTPVFQPTATRSVESRSPVRYQFSDQDSEEFDNLFISDDLDGRTNQERANGMNLDTPTEDEGAAGQEADKEPKDEQAAKDRARVEEQRTGYRNDLRRGLNPAPAGMTLIYLDDEGKSIPDSADKRQYLIDYNGFYYSPVDSLFPRVDGSGNCTSLKFGVWKSPDICYGPLYFEQVNLERFGGRFPFWQPALSGVHFFCSTVRLPYMMAADPPFCCRYAAGYGRPGNQYCYQGERPVWSLRGGTFQALLVTGIVFGL